MRSTLLALLIPSFSVAQTWQELPAFSGTARDDAAAFALGAEVFVGTGMEVGWGLTADWHAYHTEQGTWRQVASLPAAARQYATAFSLNGAGYVFGGTNGSTPLAELWRYDPGNDAWTAMASLPDTGRQGAVSFVLDGYGYVATGRTGADSQSDRLWRYDPVANSWSARAPLPGAARQLAAAFSINGMGYVVGGRTEAGAVFADAWRYDPTADSWSEIADLPDARFGARGFGNGQQALLLGGYAADNSMPTNCYHYNAVADSWAATAPFSGPLRKGAAGAVVAGTVYFGTGISGNDRLADWWRHQLPVGVAQLADQQRFTFHVDDHGLHIGSTEALQLKNVSIGDLHGRTILYRNTLNVPGTLPLPSTANAVLLIRAELGDQYVVQRFPLFR